MQHSPAQGSCEAGTLTCPWQLGGDPRLCWGGLPKLPSLRIKGQPAPGASVELQKVSRTQHKPAATGCFPTMPWVRLFFRRSKAAGNSRNVSLRFRSCALTHRLGASCPRHRPAQAGLSLEVSRRGFEGCRCVRSLSLGRSAGGITAHGCWPPSRSSYPAWLVLPGVCYVLSRISCAICMVAGG